MSVYFGGAFDPVHVAHLALAEFVSEELAEELVFLPAGHSPHKAGHVASFEQRCRMLELALEGTSFRLDSREGKRAGPSFTCDTLAELRKETTGEIYWLIGSDQLRAFRDWKQYERILAQAELLVVNRPGSPIPRDAVPHRELVWPGMELSASWLRARMAAGRSCRQLLPPGVWDYVRDQELYLAA